ncbi:hypothetical protein SteCoe_9549 [Stentor coeruleus]|uniref:Anaphase-promoting complex subunit 4 WD40 domain-containing protein n=1 Tax=Stentor coeruleus TaxID=5963 RepID=A0A1R2CHN6_9CILI|nr:hypothetical protein SteCoe_9549 [Stentor coeruleus]
MERMNINLAKAERLQPYSCVEIISKGEGCCVSEFSPCGEYLVIGCNNGNILIYSFLSHSIVWRYKPSKPGRVLKAKWVHKEIFILTDANNFYILQIQGSEDSHTTFHFKATGMDIKNDYILVYGRCDIVLHNIKTNESVSLKQDQIAVEWFGCFNSDFIVLFASMNYIFYVLNYQCEVLYKQDVSEFFQAEVRELACNGNNLFLLSARDRALRVFELKKPYEFVRNKEIFDCIEKRRWVASCFFTVPNMETWFVLACPQETGSHSLQMFDTVEIESNVSLAKNMHSPLGAAAHICGSRNTHVYPIVSVITQAGACIIWCSGNFLKSQKWSTSLGIPNFVELQRGNTEYDEPEDQFDKDMSLAIELNFPSQNSDSICFRLDYSLSD